MHWIVLLSWFDDHSVGRRLDWPLEHVSSRHFAAHPAGAVVLLLCAGECLVAYFKERS